MLKFAIYISNHGYGHATRMAALAEELIRFGIFVYIRSARPDFIFAKLNANYHSKQDVVTDVGVRHGQNLVPDLEQSRSALLDLMSQRLQIIDREVEFLRREKVDLIIADIPWLVVEAATYARVPVFAISNFDWLFIYEQLFAGVRELRPLFNTIFALYQRVERAFRLPLSSPASMRAFRQVEKTGLLVRRKDEYDNIRVSLGLDKSRPVLLCTFGGEGPIDFDLAKLCAAFPGYVLSTNDFAQAENHIQIQQETDFLDLVHGSDLLLTKPGYGIFSEAMQFGTFIIYYPRSSYPEEQVLIRGLAKYPNHQELAKLPVSIKDWSQAFKSALAIHDPAARVNNRNTTITSRIIQSFIELKYPQFRLRSVFDTGSNNLNYALVAESKSQPIHTAQISTGLGRDFTLLASGSVSIPAKSMLRYKKAVSEFVVYDKGIKSEKTVIATGIHRKIDHPEKITAWFQTKWNLPHRVISEKEELELVYLTAKDLIPKDKNAVIADIGGFSTELIFCGADGKVRFQSIPLGLLTLRKASLQGEATTQLLVRELNQLPEFRADVLISVGLTGSFLGKVLKGYKSYTPDLLHGLKLTKLELEEFSLRLAKDGFAQFLALLMEPQTAEILALSVEYFLVLLDRFACSEILTCYYGISLGYNQWINKKQKRRKR